MNANNLNTGRPLDLILVEDSAIAAELGRFNRATVDREMAMIGLKRQVNALSHELGRAPQFNLDFADAPDRRVSSGSQ